jgi:cytoskeletal protein CcmA (bactofilin family)
MFGRSDQPTDSKTEASVSQSPVSASGGTNQAPSIISADLKITGDVESAGDIQIDGQIDGDVKSRTLTLGEHARVKGSIYADKATIAGTISGQIKAKMVNIAKTARVNGDVVHETLAIEAGAYLEGRFTRLDKIEPAASVRLGSSSGTPVGTPQAAAVKG